MPNRRAYKYGRDYRLIYMSGRFKGRAYGPIGAGGHRQA